MVPTTFQGISSDSATSTSTSEAFQPCAGMDSASSDAQRNLDRQHRQREVSCRHSAACSSSSRITDANHSVPTNTRRSGEMMSCTE
jgi:hypothetical protein